MSKKEGKDLPKIKGSIVYRLINKNVDIIYIGKTDGYFKARMGQHFKQKYGDLIHKIEVVYCLSPVESLLLETHFIGKYKPQHNKMMTGGSRVIIGNEDSFKWVAVWQNGASLLDDSENLITNTPPPKGIRKSVRSQLKGLKLKY